MRLAPDAAPGASSNCHAGVIDPCPRRPSTLRRGRRASCGSRPSAAASCETKETSRETDAYAVAAGLAVASLAAPAAAADITGAGATFPFPVYSKWAEAYKKETGNGLNYQSIGSGGGIKQIQAKTVDFGATDAPLKGAELEKAGLVQFPTVMGGVVPVVNIQACRPGSSS